MTTTEIMTEAMQPAALGADEVIYYDATTDRVMRGQNHYDQHPAQCCLRVGPDDIRNIDAGDIESRLIEWMQHVVPRRRYVVRQTYETLGDPSMTTHTTREDAERAAETLRQEIAAMVATWERSGADADTDGGSESEAWAHADAIADGRTYGAAAASYIAEQAVVIEQLG